MDFSICEVIKQMAKTRKVFTSEADLQLTFAQSILCCYPTSTVRLEYCPVFKNEMHLDTLVLWPSGSNRKWIPIQLKYKTQEFKWSDNDDCFYNLKNQGAQDWGCYDYLLDISRIETVKNSLQDEFKCGYAVFITNDLLYMNGPNSNSNYYDFRICEGRTIENEDLSWKNTSHVSKQRINNIHLSGSYSFRWHEYSEIYNSKFVILVNEIKGNE